MDGAFRIAILGDDFTPSALFEEALRQTLGFWPGELVFSVADMADDDLVPYPLDEVHEAFGSRQPPQGRHPPPRREPGYASHLPGTPARPPRRARADPGSMPPQNLDSINDKS